MSLGGEIPMLREKPEFAAASARIYLAIAGEIQPPTLMIWASGTPALAAAVVAPTRQE